MGNQYGPWATQIDAGGNPQLSAFWRRRMTMLVPASQTSPTLSRRNLLWLGAAGALAGVLPTIRLAPAEAADEKLARDVEHFPAGRIYLAAHLRSKDKSNEETGDVRGIIAVDPETGRWEKILDGNDVRVSPDGKTLAFAKFQASKSGRIESAEIWRCDLATRRANQAHVIVTGGPTFFWSPDGRQIVTVETRYTEDDKSHNTTWKVNLDGSGRTKLPIPETDQVEDWSGDGNWLVAVTNRKEPFGKGYQLYRMRPDGSGELRLTKDGLNCYPRFSHDGRRIVYLHQTSKDGNSLHVMDADGTNDREVLCDEGLAIVEAGCFSPDDRRLAVLRLDVHVNEEGKKVLGGPEEANCRLEIMDADGKNRRELPLVGAKVIGLDHPDWR